MRQAPNTRNCHKKSIFFLNRIKKNFFFVFHPKFCRKRKILRIYTTLSKLTSPTGKPPKEPTQGSGETPEGRTKEAPPKNFKSPQRTDARVWEFCSKRRSVGDFPVLTLPPKVPFFNPYFLSWTTLTSYNQKIVKVTWWELIPIK